MKLSVFSATSAGVVVLYFFSIGPVIRLGETFDPGYARYGEALIWFYRPVFWVAENGPPPIARGIEWYLDRWKRVYYGRGEAAVTKKDQGGRECSLASGADALQNAI